MNLFEMPKHLSSLKTTEKNLKLYYKFLIQNENLVETYNPEYVTNPYSLHAYIQLQNKYYPYRILQKKELEVVTEDTDPSIDIFGILYNTGLFIKESWLILDKEDILLEIINDNLAIISKNFTSKKISKCEDILNSIYEFSTPNSIKFIENNLI